MSKVQTETKVKADEREVVPSTIAVKLRGLIASGVYAPGMRLGQTELADKFESSRVPVREALKMLATEGLVEHDPNRGFFVARFSTDEARQLFRLRELIEDELFSTVEWPTKAQLDTLYEHNQQLEDLLNQGNRNEWWKQHRAFQEELFNLSPCKIIVREAIRLWSLTDRYRALAPLPRRPSAERDIVSKADMLDALGKKNMRMLLEVRSTRREAFKELVLEILLERGL